jgi:hypothetical protein
MIQLLADLFNWFVQENLEILAEMEKSRRHMLQSAGSRKSIGVRAGIVGLCM